MTDSIWPEDPSSQSPRSPIDDERLVEQLADLWSVPAGPEISLPEQGLFEPDANGPDQPEPSSPGDPVLADSAETPDAADVADGPFEAADGPYEFEPVLAEQLQTESADAAMPSPTDPVRADDADLADVTDSAQPSPADPVDDDPDSFRSGISDPIDDVLAPVFAPLLANRAASRRRGGALRVSRRGLVLTLTALAAVAVVLVAFGMRAILDSSDGRLVAAVSDRSKPGFEAIVDKTPTALVLATDDSGQLDSATLLALTAEGDGGVMSIPVQTDVYLATAPGVVLPITLQALFGASGPDAARQSLGELLNLDFTDTIVLSSTDWATLVAPVAPLTVSNPAPVVGDDGSEAFPKGSISLAADQIWPFLSSPAAGQSELDRSLRQQAFWKAWLSALGAQGSDADAASQPSGVLGRYLSQLSGDRLTLQTLPVTDVVGTGTPGVQYRLAPGVTGADAISAIAPLPEGSPGRRPRLKVLDGTGDLANAEGPAIVLAAGGGQVDIIGNADSFGAATTQIFYFDAAQLPAAERMRSLLGVGEVVESRQSNSALDLTVIIGDDYQSRSSTTSSGGTGA